MNTQDYITLEEQYGAHNYHPLDVVIERGEGVWVYDVDGKKYLDCLSAYSALNQGHVHPKILEALIEQAGKITITSRAFRNDQLPLLYKELFEMTGYEMSLPMNSGAEAVETALKLARKWAHQVKGVPRHQAEIIVAEATSMGVRSLLLLFPPSLYIAMISVLSRPGLSACHTEMHLRLKKRSTRIRQLFLSNPSRAKAASSFHQPDI